MELTPALGLPRWPGWRHLPRDARDTLFLLAVIAWTLLPHVSHIPGWCTALTALVLVWRATLALTNAALPGRWILISVLAVASGLTFWSHQTLLGKEPGVTMAVVLMAMKTLELRARRDAFVVFFLGFFLVLTHFLYSQSLQVAIAMLISVWGLMTALVLAHMPVGRPSLRLAGRLAGRTALLGAPLMALLFVLFPRIGPLWGLPQDGISKTGLSNSMTLGSVAEVAIDDSIALRLRFFDKPPAPAALYLRGPVLGHFDGTLWRPLPSLTRSGGASAAAAANLRVSGPALRYEITLEPLRVAAVPLIEATVTAPQHEGTAFWIGRDLAWNAERPLLERLRFEAEAYPDFRHGPVRETGELQIHRALPAGFNPRTLAWAQQLARERGFEPSRPGPIAAALMQRIATEGYSYTLAAGAYGRDAIDEFWLDRREGFCEHFAAAFVVAMRAMGVPARIVTGYQGADPVPVDGFYIVRQSAAHAWAEYWQPGVGWIRADPTAAVAPDRINSSRRLAPQASFIAGAIGSVNPALLAQWRQHWEALENRWNGWVLQYSRGHQFELLRGIGFSAPSWEDLTLLLIGLLSALALIGAAWAWRDRRRIDPWVRQMEQVRRCLVSIGVPAESHDPPRALAMRARDRHGSAAEAIVVLLALLEEQRYGRRSARRPDAALTRRFRREARRLRTERRSRPASPATAVQTG